MPAAWLRLVSRLMAIAIVAADMPLASRRLSRQAAATCYRQRRSYTSWLPRLKRRSPATSGRISTDVDLGRASDRSADCRSLA